MKNIFFSILSWLGDCLSAFLQSYGVLGILCTVAVPLKLWLFYTLIGVSTNFFAVWLVTCIFVLLLFTSFRCKWIPAAVFLILSLLMFADVTYSSFFNRYLSVAMIGAAGVLGDITESIKEVIRPAFFLMFADAVLIFVDLVFCRLKKGKPEKKNEPHQIFYTSRENARVKKAGAWVLRHKSPFIALILALFFVGNVFGSGLVTSISNQELVSFHLKDIAKEITGRNESGVHGISAFENSYEAEKNGPLFGVAKDRNVIVIQIESFQNFVIGREYNGQEITPNLNALIKDQGSLYFDRYYQQIGSGNTSDAELATNNSLYGSLSSYSYKLSQDNYFKGLPVLLKEKEYNTSVYHAYWDTNFWNRANMYPNQGFDNFVGGEHGIENNSFDLTKKIGWGLADDEFLSQSASYLAKQQQPFYSFLITLSNHHPYALSSQYDFIDLLPADRGTTVGNYLNSAAYTDYALGMFLQQLKEDGLYDNSVIALYGDHTGLTLNDEDIEKSMTNLLGYQYDFDTMMNIPLIISVPGGNFNQTVSTVGGQLDFLPTMAYLLGFDELDTIYLGHNMLTIAEGFVAEQTYMTKGSFFAGDIAYEMSRDGVFENGRAWNVKTKESVPVKDCYENYLKSMDLVNTSEYILKNDVLRKVYLDGENAVNALSNSVHREYPDRIAIAGASDNRLRGTNSLEALNASYDAGERYIEVGINWTAEPETANRTAVLLGDWSALPDHYQTRQNEALTYEQYRRLTMKNRLTPMTYEELADWMAAHEDAVIVAKIPTRADHFMQLMNEYAPGTAGRIIPEVPEAVEYSGLYDGILSLDESNSTGEQLLDFLKSNNVWACSMSEEASKGKYKDILKSKTQIYIYEVENGILTKRN